MLKKANIQWSGKQLTKKVNNGDVLFDCAVQRGYVWDNDRKSLLIHSMIEGYPIPAFFFARRGDGKYDALDGKQRSNAIASFVAGEYCLSEITPYVYDENGDEIDISGNNFDDLPEWAQDAIKDYSLTIYYFEGITEEEISELFYRINNGKPLNSFELTRVKAKSLKQFQEIAKHKVIQSTLTEKSAENNNDEYMAMQAWAVCFTDNLDFGVKKFRPLIENACVTNDQIHILKESLDFVEFLFNSLDLKVKEERKVVSKIKKRTHLVSCIYAAKLCKENNISVEEFRNRIFEFFNSELTSISISYNEAVGSGSARPENTEKRITAMNRLFAVC